MFGVPDIGGASTTDLPYLDAAPFFSTAGASTAKVPTRSVVTTFVKGGEVLRPGFPDYARPGDGR